jgi:hypothetical protein
MEMVGAEAIKMQAGTRRRFNSQGACSVSIDFLAGGSFDIAGFQRVHVVAPGEYLYSIRASEHKTVLGVMSIRVIVTIMVCSQRYSCILGQFQTVLAVRFFRALLRRGATCMSSDVLKEPFYRNHLVRKNIIVRGKHGSDTSYRA